MKEHEDKQRGITRRQFHGLGAAALVTAATPWIAAPASAASHQLADEIPENEMLLTAIQFVSQSEKDGQQCKNCLLYQAVENGRGKCQIIQKGMVPEQGWCLSWAAKP